jgi:regulator of protease activity HflC (stomatin/prohibitin superfamily)
MRNTGFQLMARREMRRLNRGERAVVQAWERGLLLRHGQVAADLGPGAVRRWGGGYELRTVDVRDRVLQVPTQEVPTSDGVTVKVSAAAVYAIVDVRAYVLGAQHADEAVYLRVQLAVREVVSTRSVQQLVEERAELTSLIAASIPDLAALGIVLREVQVKDIVLPAELRRAQAEVLLARAQGQAALERARSETATLRGLANAARLAADNPALLQLRLLQQLETGSGNTVVLGAGLGAPVR